MESRACYKTNKNYRSTRENGNINHLILLQTTSETYIGLVKWSDKIVNNVVSASASIDKRNS